MHTRIPPPDRRPERDEPELSIGTGLSKVCLKGTEAFRAAGWTVRLVLIVKSITMLVTAGALVTWTWLVLATLNGR